MSTKKDDKVIDAIKEHGLWIPTEDANLRLKNVMDIAIELYKKNGELEPLIDVVMQNEKGDKRHVGAMFQGVDFSSHTEKLKAVLGAGSKMGKDPQFRDYVPIQITLMSEAWARPDMDDLENKFEIVMCATRTWDGREGFLSHRTVKDTDGSILGTSLYVEELVTDEENDHPTKILELFFLGFATNSAALTDVSPALKQKAAKTRDQLSRLFG